MRPQRPPTFYLVLLSGPVLLILGVFTHILPIGLRPLCLFHHLTSYPCAGCGSFRALHAFITGRWIEAWLMQPLMTLAFCALLLGSIAAAVIWLSRKPLPEFQPMPRRIRRLLWALLVLAILANWAYLVAVGR